MSALSNKIKQFLYPSVPCCCKDVCEGVRVKEAVSLDSLLAERQTRDRKVASSVFIHTMLLERDKVGVKETEIRIARR